MLHGGNQPTKATCSAEVYFHFFNVWEWYGIEFVIDIIQSREPRLLCTPRQKLPVRLESHLLPGSAILHVTADTWNIVAYRANAIAFCRDFLLYADEAVINLAWIIYVLGGHFFHVC